MDTNIEMMISMMSHTMSVPVFKLGMKTEGQLPFCHIRLLSFSWCSACGCLRLDFNLTGHLDSTEQQVRETLVNPFQALLFHFILEAVVSHFGGPME